MIRFFKYFINLYSLFGEKKLQLKVKTILLPLFYSPFLLYILFRLSEEVVEFDTVFDKLKVPLRYECEKFTEDEKVDIAKILEKIEQKPSFLKKRKSGKLRLTIFIKCSKDKCMHSVPPFLSSWKENVTNIIFNCSFNVHRENINAMIKKYPNITALSFHNLGHGVYKHLCKLESKTLLQLKLKNLSYIMNPSEDFSVDLPNLKYLSLAGKQCSLFQNFLHKFSPSLLALSNDIEWCSLVNFHFPQLQYLYTANGLPETCPNLEFLHLGKKTLEYNKSKFINVHNN